MPNYLVTAAILAGLLPATTALAEGVQPGAAPTITSTDPRDSEDTWRSILLSQEIQGALGKEVRSGSGENLGRIIDILVDKDGQVRAALIDFGGFLGVGSRKIVVDWSALHFASKNENAPITVMLTRDQVKATPEYKIGKPVVVVGASLGQAKKARRLRARSLTSPPAM